jgi:phage terminase small subunit
MEVGKKGGGKHWTADQVAARAAAAAEFERVEKVELVPPEWLSDAAMVVWEQTIKNSEGVKLLDKLDTDTLAVYCDAVAQYRKQAIKKRRTVADISLQQAWARIIAQYADKLGLTPAARARLIKKAADKVVDEFGKKFD